MLAITKSELMLIQNALDGDLEARKDAQEVVDAILTKGITVVPAFESIMKGISASGGPNE